MKMLIVPALIVLLSSNIRHFIIGNNKLRYAIGELLLGLPVDFSIAAFSAIISINNITNEWKEYHPHLILGFLTVYVIQIAIIYKPSIKYRDEGNNIYAIVLCLLNNSFTFILFLFVILATGGF